MGEKNRKACWLWNKLSDATAELYLFGVLSNETWFGDEVTPQIFANELNALGNVGEIVVRINCVGGDVFAAIAISGLLRDFPARIIAQVDGVCASAATLVMANADHVRVSPESMILIHDPSTSTGGNIKAHEKALDFLRKAKDNLIDVYERRTGIDRETLAQMMEDETVFNGEEAVALKFADELTEGYMGLTAQMGGRASWSMAALRASVADKLKKPEEQPPKPDSELLAAELELLTLI